MLVREQGRIVARDRAQRRGRLEATSTPKSDCRASSARKAGGKAGGSRYASPRPASASGVPVRRASQEHIVPGKGPSASKRVSHPPRGAVKTAEHTSRRTIKTADQAAKTAERTARAAPRTMQAAANLTRHTAQAVRATAQTAAVTAKAAARSAVGGGHTRPPGGGAQPRPRRRSGTALRPCGGRRGYSRTRGRGVPGRNPDRLTLRHLFRGRRERPGRRLSICSRGPAQP